MSTNKKTKRNKRYNPNKLKQISNKHYIKGNAFEDLMVTSSTEPVKPTEIEKIFKEFLEITDSLSKQKCSVDNYKRWADLMHYYKHLHEHITTLNIKADDNDYTITKVKMSLLTDLIQQAENVCVKNKENIELKNIQPYITNVDYGYVLKMVDHLKSLVQYLNHGILYSVLKVHVKNLNDYSNEQSEKYRIRIPK